MDSIELIGLADSINNMPHYIIDILDFGAANVKIDYLTHQKTAFYSALASSHGILIQLCTSVHELFKRISDMTATDILQLFTRVCQILNQYNTWSIDATHHNKLKYKNVVSWNKCVTSGGYEFYHNLSDIADAYYHYHRTFTSYKVGLPPPPKCYIAVSSFDKSNTYYAIKHLNAKMSSMLKLIKEENKNVYNGNGNWKKD